MNQKLVLWVGLCFVTMGLDGAAWSSQPKQNKPQTQEKVAKAPKVVAQVKKRILRYDMYYGNSKIGQMNQTETIFPNGKVTVQVSSRSKIKIFFRTFKNRLESKTVYKAGKLQTFSIDSTNRNKRVVVSGRRTPKGMLVRRTINNQTKSKVFPYKDFEATSSDLHMPIHKRRFRLKRKVLQLPRQKIIRQRILYKGTVNRKFLGKKTKAVEVRVKGPKGTANMLFTPTGRMLQMSIRLSIFGSFKIRLAKATGEPL